MPGDNLLDDALQHANSPGQKEALERLFELWRGLQWNRREAREAMEREFLGSQALCGLYRRDLERLLGRQDVEADACVQLALDRLIQKRHEHHFESGKEILAWLRDRGPDGFCWIARSVADGLKRETSAGGSAELERIHARETKNDHYGDETED
jgi:hypothetical protein